MPLMAPMCLHSPNNPPLLPLQELPTHPILFYISAFPRSKEGPTSLSHQESSSNHQTKLHTLENHSPKRPSSTNLPILCHNPRSKAPSYAPLYSAFTYYVHG